MSASRARWLLVGVVLSLYAVPTALADDAGDDSPAPASTVAAENLVNPWAETPVTRRLRAQALRFKGIARRWRALMSHPRPVLRPRKASFESLLAKRRHLAGRWRAKATKARTIGRHPPHEAEWLCIHRYEGPWADPDAPYYGGLQMDLTFQRMYGRALLRREGTANMWSRLEQMWVAERALRAGRGFYPWPVSGRRCGLI